MLVYYCEAQESCDNHSALLILDILDTSLNLVFLILILFDKFIFIAFVKNIQNEIYKN